MPITTVDVLTCLRKMADVIHENKEYLTDLDSAIGDADHGINMDRGFQAILKKLPSVEDKDAGTILKTAGMTLVSNVGGAAGPLYGTAFMQAGMAIAGKYELEAEDLLAILDAALKAVAAAEKGMKDTIPMLAKKGRASYLGERSIGHQDPGATSSYLLIKTMAEVAQANK